MDFNKILSQFPVVFKETPIIKSIKIKDMQKYKIPIYNDNDVNDDYFFAKSFDDANNFIINEIDGCKLAKSSNNIKIKFTNDQIIKTNIIGYYNNYIENDNVNIFVIYKLVKNLPDFNKLIFNISGKINKYHLFNSVNNKLPYYIVDVFTCNYFNDNLLALQHRQIDIGQHNYIKIFRKLNELFSFRDNCYNDIQQELRFGFNVILNNEHIRKVPFSNYRKPYDSVIYITNLRP